MSCLPTSGGCEKECTDPFVDHLNELTGTEYIYRNCLDATDRTKAQPETLYEDSARGELVIERKSISWPSDYAHRHSNDHFVADLFSQGLNGLPLKDDLYEVSLPLLIKGSEKELQPFVAAAVSRIRAEWSKVGAGGVLRGRADDKWWGFRRVPDWDKEDDSPEIGLKFSWEGPPMQLGDFLDPSGLPEPLVFSLNKIFSSCVKKFQSYAHARRILVLEPHGDLQHQPLDWWQDAFRSNVPPAEISEIWAGSFDWVDEYSRGWVFERLL